MVVYVFCSEKCRPRAFRPYALFFDAVVGVGLMSAHASLYLLTLLGQRGIARPYRTLTFPPSLPSLPPFSRAFCCSVRSGDKGIVGAQVAGTFVIGVSANRLLTHGVPRLQRFPADSSFRRGGILSWSFALLSMFLVSWLGFPLWPTFLNTSVNDGAVYAGMAAIFAISIIFSASSDHGFLFLFAVGLSCLTPVGWHLGLGLSDIDSSPSTMLIVILLTSAVSVHYSRLKRVWVTTAGVIVFGVTLLAMALGSCLPREWSIDFFGVSAGWTGGLATSLYFTLFAFVPALIRHRAFALPPFIAASTIFMGSHNENNFPAHVVTWLLALASLSLILRFHKAGSYFRDPPPDNRQEGEERKDLDADGNPNDAALAPPAIDQKDANPQPALKGAAPQSWTVIAVLLWISWVVQSQRFWEQNNVKALLLILLPCLVAFSVAVEARQRIDQSPIPQ